MVEAVEEASMVVTCWAVRHWTIRYLLIRKAQAAMDVRMDWMQIPEPWCANLSVEPSTSRMRAIRLVYMQAVTGIETICMQKIWMHIKYGLLNTVRPHSMKDATICGVYLQRQCSRYRRTGRLKRELYSELCKLRLICVFTGISDTIYIAR